MKRPLVLVFGVSSYLLGVSALVGWILIMLGFLRFDMSPVKIDSVLVQVIFGFVLTLLFGVQHSVMARAPFKEWISKLLPSQAERSMYVLATALVLWPILYFWPENANVVWSVEKGALYTAIWCFGIFGWAYLFIASFAINHFELFGLEQVYKYFKSVNSEPVPFKERLMYKFDRHPIMTGALIGMWATPVMRMDHLIFAALFTMYIVVGVSVEERDLIRQWGQNYLDYAKRVKTIVPRIKFKG